MSVGPWVLSRGSIPLVSLTPRVSVSRICTVVGHLVGVESLLDFGAQFVLGGDRLECKRLSAVGEALEVLLETEDLVVVQAQAFPNGVASLDRGVERADAAALSRCTSSPLMLIRRLAFFSLNDWSMAEGRSRALHRGVQSAGVGKGVMVECDVGGVAGRSRCRLRASIEAHRARFPAWACKGRNWLTARRLRTSAWPTRRRWGVDRGAR